MKTENALSLPKARRYKGFTLVELIVVITILVILGTIAFMSLSGFSGSARDGSRVSDITNLSKGLDVSYIKSGSYPAPDNAFQITYSGGVLWNQGTAGDSTMAVISAIGAKMSKKPTDPLNMTKEYTYSTLAYGNAYQLKADYEWDNVASRGLGNGLMDEAFAASGNPLISYLKGNYNGMVAKTQTGNIVYLVATPSIITSQTGATGSGFDITTALINKLITHGSTNSGGMVYTAKLVFSSGALPSTDTERITFMSGLVNAYSGTTLATHSNIQTYITTFASGNTGSLASLGGSFVSFYLGGTASVTIVSLGSGGTSASVYSGAANYTAGQQFAYNSVTVTVTGTGVGTASSSAYPSCGGDIVIWSGSINPQIWAACNAGANTLYNPAIHGWSGTIIDASSEPNRNAAYSGVITSGTNFLGNYYQWGRNDPVSVLATGSVQYSGTYQTGGVTLDSGSGFIFGTTSWVDIANHNISNGTKWTNAANNGPCPIGYHLPTGGTSDTSTEWGTAYAIAGTAIGSCSQTTVYDRLRCALALPLPGFRVRSTGVFNSQGSNGSYWSSSPLSSDLDYVSNVSFSAGGGIIATFSTRAYGYPVRCLKN